LVLQDVRNEKITADFAAREHGVIVDSKTLRIDWEATEQVRNAHRVRASDERVET